MLFSNLHAKLLEDEAKACPIDGRRFNRRSRIKMDREASAIRKAIDRADDKKKSKRKNRGIFSAEELLQGQEEKKRFKEECVKKRAERLLSDEKKLEDIDNSQCVEEIDGIESPLYQGKNGLK